MTTIQDQKTMLEMPELAEAIAGSVTVGVDGSVSSWLATRWAARFADEHGLALSVLTAHGPLAVAYPEAGFAVTMYSAAAERAERVVTGTAERVEREFPDLQVRPIAVHAETLEALAEASASARLLVLGSRGLGALMARLRGAVSDAALARARGDVVIVPESDTAEGVLPMGQPRGPVVLGIDDGELSAPLLKQAFDLARAGSGRLVAVQAWPMPVSALRAFPGVPLSVEPSDLRDHVATRDALYAALQPYADGVEVRVKTAMGDAADLLARAGDGAELVVVGSRGRGPLAGWLLGSTSRRLARYATCPVYIVRRPGEVPAQQAGPTGEERVPRFVD